MTAAVSLNSQTYLGHNQEAYQELRLALQLNLRRQLLIAVCDDAALQGQLAQRLEGNFSPLPESVPVPPEVRSRQLTLVTLPLSGERPDLVREVLLWLKQQQRLQGRLPPAPMFQVVGIDQLTRQSPTVQNRFLASLTRVDALLTQLDCRLVVWVPRPWLGKIRQSVPGFWRSRSGLFEFVGEPSPQTASPTPAPDPAPKPPAAEHPALWQVLRDDLSTFEQPAPPPVPASPPPESVSFEDRSLPQAQVPRLQTPQNQVPENEVPGHKAASPPPLSLPNLLSTAATAAAPGAQPDLPQGYPGLEPGTFLSVIMPPGEATAAATLAALQQAEPAPVELAPPDPPEPEPEPEPPSPEGLRPVDDLSLPPDLAQDADLVNLWRYIQGLIDQQAGPLTLARAYLALGQIGRDRVAVDAAAPSLLDFATAVYNRAIAGLPKGSADWCDALNDLASLYWLQGQHPATANPAPWLRRSVATYEKALKGGQGAIPADTLGRIYGNLGTVYGLLAGLDDSVPGLEKAVEAYNNALTYSPAARSPIDYANLQNSLGAIHWRLAQHQRPQHHLAQAIAAYGEALAHREALAAPIEYAMIQNNLGIAYWSLAQHQQPVFLLERAIVAYQAALQYRTVASSPAGCAATANNLGTAYWDLAQQPAIAAEPRLAALHQAITAYEMALTAAETALQASPLPALGFDLWATCHSAGVVHDQLAQALPVDQSEARQRHLDMALNHYLLAYQGWHDQPQQLEVLITALVYNAHLNFEFFGIAGQQAVLSKLPGELLPEVLRRL
jgi:tetratricopeptide (TPR) repeat protein